MSLNLLIIDDEEEICLSLKEFFEYYGYSCRTISRPDGFLEKIRKNRPDVILLDLKMPGTGGIEILDGMKSSDLDIPIIVISGYASIQDTVRVMKLGALNLYTKPVDMDTLLEEIRGLEPEERSSVAQEEIVTQDARMLQILNMAREAARTDATVLVTGESGTGKELIANTIHQYSNRSEEPFVKVNCAAIMQTLLESEIFGHEKGAFTGADKRKIGLFEQAGRGSIFLDEIGDMSMETQAKMLRILQDGKYSRVGGSDVLKADCRIIAATNKNFQEEIARGGFREDLYYRLSVVTLNLPPLRKRVEDLAILTRYFIRTFNRQYGKQVRDFNDEVWNLIYKHSWPGNIRELKNFVQRLIIFADGEIVGDRYIPEQYRNIKIGNISSSSLYEDLTGDAAKKSILDALERSGGVKSRAAEILGVDRKTLYNRMKKYDLL